ncbi:MAG: hypothetical protein M1833_001164 [Piccolia ochrophora]|nr:MAG: hypothetical protein M1833_001164 [Piccolia ochrophora]
MGPNWIHGTQHNPILDVARQTGSSLHSWKEGLNIVDEKGSLLSRSQAKAASDRIWSIINDAFKYSNDFSSSIPPSESLLDYVASRIQEDSASPRGDRTELEGQEAALTEQQLLWVAQLWGPFIGDAVQRQSLKFFWLEECIEGENLFISSTYKSVLNRVAELPLKVAELQLNKKVIQIECVVNGRDGAWTLVETQNGETQYFDEVVITAPLGWLKRNEHAFTPGLSPEMSHAIASISYGHLEKVYVTFPQAFWQRSSEDAVPGSTSGEDHEDYEFDDFTHWMRPTYAPDQNPNSWTQDCVNLAAINGECAQPTLLFYLYGPCSAHITSLLSSHDQRQHHDLLDAFFLPYYSRLPNYCQDSSECSPIGILATRWSTDELAGFGSYSNFQVGLTNADKEIEAMRYGMPERRFWFAGEHTAPFVAIGTTTGAYWSGEGVAQRIIEAYGGTRTDPETFRAATGKGEPRMVEREH